MTDLNSKEYFIHEAKNMWNVKHTGEKVNIPINWYGLKNQGMYNKHIKYLKKYFTLKSGELKDNVTYYHTIVGNKLTIFLEESDGIFDWKQNLLAFSFKVKIGDFYRRYHLGFYATALSIFKDLNSKGLLKKGFVVDLYGYSHGAGALPSLFSMIKHESFSEIINQPKKFEPPRDIYLPCKEVKDECREHINFIQGNDIVTKVPWWMTAIGIKIKIKGQSMPWYNGLLRPIFNHDIYWTDDKR